MPESPGTGPPPTDAETRQTRGRGRGPTRIQRGRRLLAIGFMQIVGLVGIVGLGAALGAVLVSSAKEPGWAAGLIIGAVGVVLTILVLASGRHIRRH